MQTGCDPLIRSLLIFPLLALYGFGWIVYVITKQTPTLAYRAFRSLHFRTNGRLNEFISTLITIRRKRYDLSPTSDIFSAFDRSSSQKILDQISKEGYCILPQRLPSEMCDELEKYARENKCYIMDSAEWADKPIQYNPSNVKGTRYQFTKQDLIEVPAVQNIVTDGLFLYLAQQYLHAPPICDLVYMWWSTAYLSEPNDYAAQLFHIDLDRMKFILFFIYLTDVTPETGPHVFVSGSHLRSNRPSKIMRDGKIPDDVIDKYFPGKVKELTGARGTILMVDTLGFHKGKKLLQGDRLMFEVSFANSLFGNKNVFAELSEDQKIRAHQVMKQYPKIFQGIRWKS